MQGNYSDIVKIAAPVILGSIAQTSISVADTAILGKLGNTELAAIGLVSLYYLMLFMIGFAYTKGTQIMIARRIGQGKLKGAGAVFDNSLAVILSLGIVLTGVIYFGAAPAMHWLVKDEAIRRVGIEFLEMRSWGITFSLLGSVFLSFYMGINHVRILVFNIISMALINIFLCYGLVFGEFGFPLMGVKGAALAANIAELVAALVFIVYSFMGNYTDAKELVLPKEVNVSHIRRKKFFVVFHMFQVRRLSWGLISSITKLSAPIVLQTLIGLSGWSFFFYFVEKMGPQETAISSAAKNIYMFFGLFAWGFSTSANTIISNLMGQKQQGKVIQAIKRILLLSFVCQLLTAIPLIIIPESILQLYTDDMELIRLTVPVIHICVVALLIYSLSSILFHCIVSTGSVISSLVIEIISIVGYIGYIYWIFSVSWRTVPIVWTSEVFYWLFLAVLTLIYFQRGTWRQSTI
ncbi:MAG: MATE family efflux transporter [Chitinophagales bacterium]|nr:MATE family efflux transporter [Chitinophagales bacterium]